MNVLVTGSKGQLGMSIQKQSGLFPGFQFIYTDVDELDITNEEFQRRFFTQNKIDAIINCAAYTAVDKAEEEIEKAFLINSHAVKNLALLSKEFGYTLIHISTDFVFDGASQVPYLESDSTCPLSVYGQSKLEGENNVIRFADKAVIIRTSWLYSEYGNNFLKTIRRIGSERAEIKVVNDQIGTPTYAGDLAETILKILKQDNFPDGVRIFHYSDEGMISWFDFAVAIVELSQLNCIVKPIPTSEYPLPAKRPGFSVLETRKIKREFKLEIHNWKDQLKKCIRHLNSAD